MYFVYMDEVYQKVSSFLYSRRLSWNIKHSSADEVIILLPIEIHVTVCELQATHRPTIAGLLLQNCVIQVSLLFVSGGWNSGAAQAGVHRGAAIGFGKQ